MTNWKETRVGSQQMSELMQKQRVDLMCANERIRPGHVQALSFGLRRFSGGSRCKPFCAGFRTWWRRGWTWRWWWRTWWRRWSFWRRGTFRWCNALEWGREYGEERFPESGFQTVPLCEAIRRRQAGCTGIQKPGNDIERRSPQRRRRKSPVAGQRQRFFRQPGRISFHGQLVRQPASHGEPGRGQRLQRRCVRNELFRHTSPFDRQSWTRCQRRLQWNERRRLPP
jgi:hypothetical protein